MKERPILFKGSMVRAILEGSKTQTRRIIKPQPPFGCEYSINGNHTHALCHTAGPIDDKTRWVPPTPKSTDYRLPCPFGVPGDRLWVRETFGFEIQRVGGTPHERLVYRSTRPEAAHCYDCNGNKIPMKWRPSIYMPRRFSRIDLEITSVRVERLQDISAEDANAEGAQEWIESHNQGDRYHHNGNLQAYPVTAFSRLWETINGAGSWDANPWIWVVEFKLRSEPDTWTL